MLDACTHTVLHTYFVFGEIASIVRSLFHACAVIAVTPTGVLTSTLIFYCRIESMNDRETEGDREVDSTAENTDISN